MSSYYSEKELESLGFKSFGCDVKLSRYANIYGCGNISLGNHVRIDDFCILSGNITIGNYVHIAAYCGIFAGEEGVEFSDYSAISSRSSVYAASDDYCGDYITNPTVDDQYRHVISGKVVIQKHVIIGSGCCILPNVTLQEGCAVGSMSLVNKTLESWKMYVGIPAKYLKDRKRGLLKYEKEIEEDF